MATIIKIDANFPWTVSRRAPDRRWIGVCDPLNLAMEADSLDELRSVVGEAVDLLLRDLLQDNELHTYLGARGWKVLEFPKPDDPHDVQFQVPVHLIVPVELIRDAHV
jgi:hypothetical protein